MSFLYASNIANPELTVEVSGECIVYLVNIVNVAIVNANNTKIADISNNAIVVNIANVSSIANIANITYPAHIANNANIAGIQRLLRPTMV